MGERPLEEKMPRVLLLVALACLGMSDWLAASEQGQRTTSDVIDDDGSAPSVAEVVAQAEPDPVLRALLLEALSRNPHLATLGASAMAAASKADRVGGLPDLQLMVTGYVEPPETRVGPQRLMATVGQQLPWGGKRQKTSDAQRHRAREVDAALAAAQLELVTSVRRLYHELGFVLAEQIISEDFRQHLIQHEQIARSRYTSGAGAGQGVLKLQAEITRVDRGLLDLTERANSLTERINGLVDRAPGTALKAQPPAGLRQIVVDREALSRIALSTRPEMQGASARVSAAESEMELAEQKSRPDFMLGLTYAWVDERDDPAGRLSPPPDNGQDIWGIQGGIRIPLWRQQRHAGLEEATAKRSAGEFSRLQIESQIESRIADVAQRLDLTWRQLRLLEDLLIVQAEEALQSAQTGYVAGTLNALDLFDAEHLLFDTRTAVARTKADYLIAQAEMEGAVGRPIGGTS